MAGTRQFDGEFAFHAAGTESEQNDAIAEANGLTDVVRDEDDGASGFAPDALEFVVQQVAGLRVESGERLVHQKDVGLGGQGAGNGYALPHAARKLVNVAVLKFSEVYEPEIVFRLLQAFGLGNTLHLHAEFDVLANGEPWEKAVFLEDEDAVGARALHGISVDKDLAGCLRVQAGNQVEQSGLTAARGPDDAEKFARLNLKIDVVESKQALPGLRAVAERDVVQADFRDFARDGPG